jgi:putative DNA primase/helicase
MKMMNFNNMPQELQRYVQWVNWKLVKRNNKDTKVPYSPKTRLKASVSDPLTWGSFKEAVQQLNNGFNGIGFVLTENDPFVGIDLDEFRDPKTGEVQQQALDIIASLDSYCELSPSGDGFHIWLKGNLPQGKNRNGHFEIYDRNRYLTITGEHFGTSPKSICTRQSEMMQFYEQWINRSMSITTTPVNLQPITLNDRELVRKAILSRNGWKFEKLWLGEWQQLGYSSQSEADQALCNFLAFWTAKDVARMNDLFKKSNLYRPKWDEIHTADGISYGQTTLLNAIEKTGNVYNGKTFKSNVKKEVTLPWTKPDQI